MNTDKTNLPKLSPRPHPIVFPADVWEHVCPVIRISGPAEFNQMEFLRGCEWENGNLTVQPHLIQESDLVIIQRDFPARMVEYEKVMEEARRLGKTVIYEIDDLLPELPGKHADVIRYHPTRLAILRALVEADVVTCSTPALEEYLRTYNPNTYILPNYLNDRLWSLSLAGNLVLGAQAPPLTLPDHSLKPSSGQKPVEIGYLGSDGHIPDLAMIESILAKLLKHYGKRVALKIWGMVPPNSLRTLSNVSWTQVGMVSYAKFVRYFQEQSCDIFIAPLLDHPFNHCKSPLKFLEYSSMGIPGIYSDLTPYQMVVEPGENGFLAANVSEWETFLIELIENQDLRQRIGKAAYETVEAKWLLSNHADEWIEVYNNELIKRDSQKGITVSTEGQKFDLAIEFAKKAQLWQLNLSDYLQSLENDKSRLIKHSHDLSREINRLTIELTSKEQAFLTVNSLYHEIINSNGWKMMLRLFRMREKLVPIGSRRESLLKMVVFSLRVIRNEGITAFLKGFLRRIKAKITGDKSPSAVTLFTIQRSSPEKFLSGNSIGDPTTGGPTTGGPSASAHPLPVQVIAGTMLDFPAISIIVIKPPEGVWSDDDVPDLDEAIAWINQQTIGISAIETIYWDIAKETAWKVDITTGSSSAVLTNSWSTTDNKALLDNLRGRYLCIAYRDLLLQAEVYLEENFIALETEALAFSVNLHGFPDWIQDRIDEGYLPGGDSHPFFRQIVSVSCVKAQLAETPASVNGFRLDYSHWLEDRGEVPNVIGKLIIHTSNEDDQYESLPLGSRFPSGNLRRSGIYLVSTSTVSPADGGIGRFSRVMYSLDSVIPFEKVPSEKPTVILAMTFLAVGGAEQLALNIIDRLRDKARFVVLSTDEMDPSQGTMFEAFREITPYVYMAPDFIDPLQRISFVLYLIERFQPQTFYIANGANVLYEALDPIKRRYPHVRTMTQVYDYTEGWINRYDISLVTNLDAHIAPHSKICNAYVEKGARPEKVFQVPAVVYVDKFHPEAYTDIQKEEIRLRLKLPQDRKIVTFASRMNAQKRPMDFILLAQKFNDDPTVAFLMIGEGQEAEGVDLVISKLGLKNLYRHKFYRPINDVLAITDALVLPSSFEGMPLIIAETLAMGKPVVVTDVGNNKEVIDVTGGGIVIHQVGDVQALADGVRQVLDNPPDPKKLRNAVYEHFSIEAGADLYYRIFMGEAGPEESFAAVLHTDNHADYYADHQPPSPDSQTQSRGQRA